MHRVVLSGLVALRNHAAWQALLLFAWMATITLPALAAETKPNFVVINIDDLGYADIGPFGSTSKTPNLDRMAREGRRLTSHYAAPVCSPSRSALMTGCYPKRVLPIPHVLFPASSVGLHPDQITIAEVLKPQGYATACVGKWHLGDQKEFLPTNQGFDEYFGIPYSNDMGTAAEGSKSNPGKPLPQPKPANNPMGDEYGLRGNSQPPLPLLMNSDVFARVGINGQFAVTRMYTEMAIQFITMHEKEPFFLYIPHTAVHFPLYPSDKFRGQSPNGLLGDWAEEVDWSVGQILDTLRERKLDQNTLVIFTSDNGGSLPHGSNNTPLRGSKGSTFEGGIRVPTIAWWPGKIPAGTSTDAITSMMDILPTVAALAGADLPTDRTFDGVNQWSVLSGNAQSGGEPSGDSGKPPRDHFFYFRGFQLEAVRQGDWKLHLALSDGTGRKKTPPRPQLFDLDKDIAESKDVSADHPEIVKQLQELAQTMAGDLGLDGIGPGCRQLGQVENPQPLIAADGTVRPDAAGLHKSLPE